jgi:hypothetical protein
VQRPLQDHIAYLEQKIVILNKELVDTTKTLLQRNEIKIDLGIAERSLVHFRKAFELEKRLSH